MIFINQLRQKIGMFVGNPETTTGGNALKFYASVRLDVRRISQIKEGDEVIGSRIRAKVVKNKGGQFRQAEFDMMYGVGISREGPPISRATKASCTKAAPGMRTRRTALAKDAKTPRSISRTIRTSPPPSSSTPPDPGADARGRRVASRRRPARGPPGPGETDDA